ncbi:MAG: glycine cleavage system protein GcvH [Actinomycetia bacterium]|nr:glycine cleavage system protein GcvH [Actinomycetes bacterium]
MAEIPDDLRFTRDHEWVRLGEDGVARVGVTAHATEQMGDIVYVSLPTVGAQVAPGDSCAELESTKSVSDVFAPVGGIIAAVNDGLADAPESINAEPYGQGWLFEIEVGADQAGIDALLDAASYRASLD